MDLVDLISDHIENYESQKWRNVVGEGVDVLKFLMQSHDLLQSDLPEIGSQGVISEILNGKRQLNRRQIQCLAKRFNAPAEAFFDAPNLP